MALCLYFNVIVVTFANAAKFLRSANEGGIDNCLNVRKLN